MSETPGSGPVIIEPVDFRRGPARARRGPGLGRIVAGAAGMLLVLALVGSAWFVLVGQQIEVTVEPVPDSLALDGPWPRLRLGERLLLRRGEYRVRAELAEHAPLDVTFTVPDESGDDAFHFVMRELPGLVTVRAVGADDAETALVGARVHVGAEDRGVTPLAVLELDRGEHDVRITHARYRGLETSIAVAGRGRAETVVLELRPNWADVSIECRPEGAELWVDGDLLGTAPCRVELASGLHEIELRADGYDDWRRELTVVAERPVTLDGIELERAKGRLVVTTEPSGAQVMIDNAYAGLSPIEIDAAPDLDLLVRVVRDGYDPAQRSVRVGSREREEVSFALEPQLGMIRLQVKPPDATLVVDDEPRGPVPAEIALPAVAHRLEFQREGYVPAVHTVRPRPDVPQRLVVTLEPVDAPKTAAAVQPTAANGYPLVEIPVGSFTMGSSRREQGRRTNEPLRSIRLERRFLMGTREVTNREFAAFRPEHQSGMADNVPLSGRDRPVVQVTWDDAARFCNWLSDQDGLAVAYVEREGAMHAVEPMSTGYRLPTEAEWEYAARFDGTGALLKYPWGATFPPRAKTGNFADESAKQIVVLIIDGYEDGSVGPAPTGAYPPNAHGLHDMGGNVAEWSHDFYTTYAYSPDRTDVDPAGPKEGRHHVVRGSSWRHSSIGTLRFAAREYSDDKRDDLGFRVCRYVDDAEDGR